MLHRKKAKRSSKVDWQKAPDVQIMVNALVDKLELNFVDTENIHCFRSYGSRARAYARIWGLGKIWQQALDMSGAYCIEVLAENFDHLSSDKKAEVLIHELCHIPKNFSGSLLPHTRKRGKRNFHDRVHELVSAYNKNKFRL